MDPASAQTILREYWLGITGSGVAALTNNAAFPLSPSGSTAPTLFEGPVNFADNYGTRFRGYVKPPTTGNYTFWIAGDEHCELWLSTDDTAAKRKLIARVLSYTGSRVWSEPRDNNYLAQKSTLIPLVAGQLYYIEALHKEIAGNDNIAVGWQLPSGVFERPIPGARLEAYQIMTNAPSIRNQPENVTVIEGQEARFTVVALGLEPITYQWERDGAILPIERSATLILTTTSQRDSGAKFRCVIANAKGTTNTVEAILTVNGEMTPPTLISFVPAAGATARELAQVEVTFSEPVDGVDAADLLVNGTPATEASGGAAGPYLFKFAKLPAGAVRIEFAPGHGIKDVSASENSFAGASWNCAVDPTVPLPKIRISELNASNETGLVDDENEAQDWIELENFGATAVNLAGWSLSDDQDQPGGWIFPNVSLAAGQRLVVFASGKDRAPAGKPMHTNFLLAEDGEFLGLFDASSPRQPISTLDPYPEQRVNYSYGIDPSGVWSYYLTPTPGTANGISSIVGIVSPPRFSNQRGFYSGAFQVFLTTDEPEAEIRFTTNGGDPSGPAGLIYTNAINIASTITLRASVWKTNYLPSFPETHTYLYNVTGTRRSLPAVSIVTATNNLFGPTGIIGIRGGTYAGDGVWRAVNPATDYHNPDRHGLAWERPTSVEYFSVTNAAEFQIDCGIRVQGSDYIRPRYMPSSKFSYRLYFRGDYGPGQLEFPLFKSAVTTFDQLVVRAGHNDDTNPFIKDELVRRLFIDCGQVGSHGAFHTLYLNGVYKGYYNLVERIEKHFCQAWHGGKAEWDVIEQNQIPLDGDAVNFSAMMSFLRANSMTNNANYLEMTRRLDLTNFVDYLLVNIYGANGDWPGNNWRAAREKSNQGIWRFYVWDAEFSFGTYGQSPTHDSFANQLAEPSDIPVLYQNLRRNPEFLLFFADRVQKHFYNNGALTDTNVTRNFLELRSTVSSIISGFDSSILTAWIPQRRKAITNHFKTYGVAGAPGAPSFNQFGGRVAAGFQLAIASTATGAAVNIYYTTDGSDPRTRFTGAVAPTAQRYTGAISLYQTTLVRARMQTNSVWSALTEATFEVSQFGAPLRFTEVNYRPPGGDAYEFVELKNFSGAPIDLGGMSLDGINYRFPERTLLAAGGIVVLASDAAPAAFASRYPGVSVMGYFGAALANAGERLLLKDKENNILASVEFDDEKGWPLEASGGGYSLELANRESDPNSPVAWRKSVALYGSPGAYADASEASSVVLNEIAAIDGANPAWIELFNPGPATISLAGFSLGDLNSARRVVFPAGTSIAAGGYYLHTGFPLPASGGTIFLYDANTNRLDALALGRQYPAQAFGRINGIWTLTTPTPNLDNTAATLAPATALAVNEWLANALSGAEDWLEFFNSGNAPVALQGMTLSVSNSVYRIPTLTFLPARGFAQWFASEKVGAHHLAFKLPAAGGQIRLYDPSGALVNTVSYGAQLENVSEGRLPDGSATLTKFRGSPSPDAANYLINASSPLVINEIMTRNVRAVIDPFGGAADWIEIYNSGAELSLEGCSLSADRPEPGQWTFPAGAAIPNGGYLVVWFDKTQPASTRVTGPFNTGEALSAEGGGVYLFNPLGQVIDQIEYGAMPADLPFGRTGGSWTLLDRATPGALNAAAIGLASSVGLRINEWSPARENSPGWIELFNPSNLPVWIGTMSLTDELTLLGQKKFVLPQHSYLGARGFLPLTATSESTPDAGEINFNVSAFGESLRLYTPSLAIADTVSFGVFPTNAALAKIPDGAASILSTIPTPGEGNHLPLPGIAISEISPVGNFIEIQNSTDHAIDLSGWGLSDDPFALQKAVLAPGTILPARGYLAITPPAQIQLDAAFGGQIILALVRADLTLSGEQARLDYGPGAADTSYGRLRTTLGSQNAILAKATPGAANTTTMAPAIVISEIMYHPLVDLANSEFVDLTNPGSTAVGMSNWRINGGVQFNFPTGFSLPAGATATLVHFDPVIDTTARAAFEALYHLPTGTLLVGPLRGNLANDKDDIVLERPLPALASGYVPHLTVDRVDYGDQIPWPIAADGSGASLHRVRAADFGNEPLNWIAAAPKPTAPPEVRERSDRDGDGMPDIWETAHGLDLYDATDGARDLDGDGINNLAEFQSGSDPGDPGSGFRLDVPWLAAGPALQFTAPAGQIFKIETRPSLVEGAWELHATVGPFDTATVVSAPLLAEGIAQRFYRVVR